MTETTTEKRSSPAVDENNAVDSLLRSCASIRKRTRSCLTITHQHGGTTKRTHKFPSINSSEEYARRIREEERTGVELERKIFDYRAAIGRLKRRQEPTADETQQASTHAVDVASSKAATKAATQQHRIARNKLMDETLRQQQEELLLERLAMSQPAIAAAYHSTTTTAADEDEDDNGTKAMKTLIQEATRCRNKQVRLVLEAQRNIDEIKRQLTLESDKGRQLQQDNQALWQELQQLKVQKHNPSVNNSKVAMDNSEEQRLATETLILKRALLDIITGSDLDWYNDERLRQTLLRLEH